MAMRTAVLAGFAVVAAWFAAGASRARAAVLTPSRSGAGGVPIAPGRDDLPAAQPIGLLPGERVGGIIYPTDPINRGGGSVGDPITAPGFQPASTGGARRTWSRYDLERIVDAVADRSGVPRSFVRAIVDQESGWRYDLPRNSTGDWGLFQLNEQHFGKTDFPRNGAEAMNPEIAALGAVRLLSEARAHWRTNLAAIAAEYNGGYSLAQAGVSRGNSFANQRYVDSVLGFYERRGGVIV